MPHKTIDLRREYEAKYREQNRDKVRAKVRAHYHRNLDESRRNGRDRAATETARQRAHRYRLWTTYRITPEHYTALLEKQKGVCAVCSGKRQDRGRLQVDHCHATGKVRGLLCGPCNRAIGCLGESIDLLRKAALYVESFNCNS